MPRSSFKRLYWTTLLKVTNVVLPFFKYELTISCFQQEPPLRTPSGHAPDCYTCQEKEADRLAGGLFACFLLFLASLFFLSSLLPHCCICCRYSNKHLCRRRRLTKDTSVLLQTHTYRTHPYTAWKNEREASLVASCLPSFLPFHPPHSFHRIWALSKHHRLLTFCGCSEVKWHKLPSFTFTVSHPSYTSHSISRHWLDTLTLNHFHSVFAIDLIDWMILWQTVNYIALFAIVVARLMLIESFFWFHCMILMNCCLWEN